MSVTKLLLDISITISPNIYYFFAKITAFQMLLIISFVRNCTRDMLRTNENRVGMIYIPNCVKIRNVAAASYLIKLHSTLLFCFNLFRQISNLIPCQESVSKAITSWRCCRICCCNASICLFCATPRFCIEDSK